MARKPSHSRNISVYSNLAQKRRTKRDAAARNKAEYLASLPKNPIKRTLYRLHPKRFWGYWFSKKGLVTGLKVLGVAILFVFLLVGALFAYYRKDLDSIKPGTLANRVQTTVTKYYARDGKTLLWEDKGTGNYKLVVKDSEISQYMKDATVALEDKDFFKHGAISVSGLMRSALSNSQGNATQGGSTITQQLVKQVFFADEAQQRGLAGIPRKIKEIILSIEVERMYSKKDILMLYLNESPYGGRRNGVESAAQTYFGISAKKLNLAQSALLAAVPNQPGLYDPNNAAGHKALIARQHKTLDAMVNEKYITKAQADKAKAYPILDSIRPLSDQNGSMRAPHFVQMVRSQLERKLGKATVGQGGLTVVTTLDMNVQNMLEGNMNAMFSGKLTNQYCGYAACPGYAGFKNGAGAVEDTKTGQLIAMVGSRDYDYAGFGQDNAAAAMIQPGSSIKPFVYAQLFQDQGGDKRNYGSGDILSDVRTTFPGDYTPQNADNSFRGNISIRRALDLSRNIPAIKAMAINGIEPTWKTIREMGNSRYCTVGQEAQAGLSSAIGGCGTRLIDHTNALASFSRMGAYKPQSTILKVTNSKNQVLEQYKDVPNKQVIDQQAAYIVNDILGDSSARSGLGGTDYVPTINALGAKVAAKTGTSNAEINGRVAAKDIWTVGYTPTLSMSVWLGNPDTTPLSSGNSLIPAMIFDRTMASAIDYYTKKGKAKTSDWFTQPSGIQRIGNEVYPSYWKKSQARSNENRIFDKVSKKLATECTPENARVEISVTKTTDPYTKRVILSAPDGYNPNERDDIHKCDDSEPRVSVSVEPALGRSYRISAVVTAGSNPLESLEIKVNGSTVKSLRPNGSGTYSASFTPEGSGSQSVSATVTDRAAYSSSDSTSFTPSRGGNRADD